MSLITISAKDVLSYLKNPKVILIDLRDSEDYLKGHIPGALNIPYEKLEEDKLCLLKQYTYLVYCERGNTSLMAARILSKKGYSVINVYGGIHAYRGELS